MVKMPQRQRHNTGGGTGGADLPIIEPGIIEAHNTVPILRCCMPLPSGCVKGYEPISLETPSGCIRVVCNNQSCTAGCFMHRECFHAWEQYVLSYLRTCGRARSWSEKQRLQNLWTKKGYDLAYRACCCLCGLGHLRKDLDWSSQGESEEEKNKRKKKNKPRSVISSTWNCPSVPCQRHRTSSISSTGSSPPSDSSQSPYHQNKKKEERTRHGSGSIFARRLDFSSFNSLPRTRLNSYHIKMEDDSSHGNDETRCFILSTLAAQRTCRTTCLLCYQTLLVFDRYPLIDGTFFLTPVMHNKNVLPVQVDGKVQYLTAICMACLEGWSVSLRCRYCNKPWNGSSLILGTMYSFDVFAAMPCCEERLKCKQCRSLVISPSQRLSFFSEYSRTHSCPSCGYSDHHFVQPISLIFTKEELQTW